MINTLIPLYQSEGSPPSSREIMVGPHGALAVTGYVNTAKIPFQWRAFQWRVDGFPIPGLAAWVGLRCYFEQSPQVQWHLALALRNTVLLFAFIIPLMNLVVASLCLNIGSPLVPESPRWLGAWGRKDDTLQVLVRLHDALAADDDQDLARQDFMLIVAQIAQTQRIFTVPERH